MVMMGRPNCQHLDKMDDCCVLHGQTWAHRMFNIRPRCVLLRPVSHDGDLFCADIKPFPRPPAPAPRKK